MSDLYFLIFGIICALIGGVLIVLNIHMIFGCRMKIYAAITAIKRESTVIRGSTVHTYRPAFTYTVDGSTYHGTCPFTSFKKEKYAVGDALQIFVSKADPSQYRFKGKIGLLTAGMILLGIGLLFIILYWL